MLESLKLLLGDVKEFEFSNDIYFVGGTALEERINHRTSYDIDLLTIDNTLDRTNLDFFIEYLKNKGREVESNTRHP